MHQQESPLYEGVLPGVFVHNSVIHELDSRLSMLFVTLESVRQYLLESDDGSLESQLLRRALHEGFFDVLRIIDRVGLLDDCSQYPEDLRAARRMAGVGEIAGMPTPVERNLPDVLDSGSALTELSRVGRMLLRSHLLRRELRENEARRKELLRLEAPSGDSEGDSDE